MGHSGDTEKYKAPKSQKKEYTRDEMSKSFRRGMGAVLVIQMMVFAGYSYFSSHSVNDALSSLKSVSMSVISMVQKEEV